MTESYRLLSHIMFTSTHIHNDGFGSSMIKPNPPKSLEVYSVTAWNLEPVLGPGADRARSQTSFLLR